MARDGSGNYTLPANTQAVSGDPISSTKFNTLVQDLEADANTDRPIVAGGTGASTALAARANLGLEIGVNVQAYDAGLLSIAGLTTLADRSIYTTASDTYAVYTLTAAGRAILDDADASAQRTTLGLGNGATTTFSAFALTLADDADAAASRTTLGLGTIATQDANNVAITGGSVAGITDLAVADGGTGASDAGTARTNLGLGTSATVNTGTSGATIPLLNGANTFSAAQIFSGLIYADRADNEWAVLARNAAGTADRGGLWVENGRLSLVNAAFNARIDINSGVVNVANGTLQAGSNTVWHAGNDGAGSGLDADTLDGVQGSAFPQKATTNTFTAAQTIEPSAGWSSGNTAFLYVGDANNFVSAEFGGPARIAGFSAVQIFTSQTSTIAARFSADGIRAKQQASSETSGTLTAASANTTIQATGDITIPNAVFAAGDIILIYAGASSRTITQGSSVTMRLGGTATTGSRTLAARGVAVLFFVSSSEVVVSGGAVT